MADPAARPHMGPASTADLVIAAAYFLIPLEITIYLLKRRYGPCVRTRERSGAAGRVCVHRTASTDQSNHPNRSLWVVERRSWAVSILFVAFILLCGLTHLFAILHVRAVRIRVYVRARANQDAARGLDEGG